MTRRAEIQLPDVIVGSAVFVAAVAVAPAYHDLTSRIAAEAGPLSGLLLQLVVPMLMLGVIISFGVSARRSRR